MTTSEEVIFTIEKHAKLFTDLCTMQLYAVDILDTQFWGSN